jgi:hypothetical protein
VPDREADTDGYWEAGVTGRNIDRLIERKVLQEKHPTGCADGEDGKKEISMNHHRTDE